VPSTIHKNKLKRAYYIDNIRIALTALVIVHHSALAFGASGGWCYISPEPIKGWTQLIFSAFLTINQAFFMSLFFFISACFTPGSFDRKGLKKYPLDRLKRLGIPLLIYSVLINPCLGYFILLHQNNVNTNLIEYMIKYNITSPNTFHLWFVLVKTYPSSDNIVLDKFGKNSLS
jgi:fucose 4-O-acetylase-like acetyltransferase